VDQSQSVRTENQWKRTKRITIALVARLLFATSLQNISERLGDETISNTKLGFLHIANKKFQTKRKEKTKREWKKKRVTFTGGMEKIQGGEVKRKLREDVNLVGGGGVMLNGKGKKTEKKAEKEIAKP